jgi:hypothetical protein
MSSMPLMRLFVMQVPGPWSLVQVRWTREVWQVPSMPLTWVLVM